MTRLSAALADPERFDAWHAYWHVALAARTAAARVEAQHEECRLKSVALSELDLPLGSEGHTRAKSELADANRALDYLTQRFLNLQDRANRLEAEATGDDVMGI